MIKPMPTRSKDDIDQMEAGRAIDLLVARLTSPRGWDEIYHPQGSCGFTGCSMCEPSCPRYSSDIAMAWLVVEKLRSQGFDVWLHIYDTFTSCEFFKHFPEKMESAGRANAPTAAIAICRAALKVYWS